MCRKLAPTSAIVISKTNTYDGDYYHRHLISNVRQVSRSLGRRPEISIVNYIRQQPSFIANSSINFLSLSMHELPFHDTASTSSTFQMISYRHMGI